MLRHKASRVYSVCFHFYEILEQVKLIPSGRENQYSSCLGEAKRVRIDWDGAWGDGNVLYFDKVWGYTDVYCL